MSAAQSEPLKTKLDALQCHFTWDLHTTENKLFRIRDQLQDIGTDEGNSWLGHIYNLLGYIQFNLGDPADARRFFMRAAEAFRHTRNTGEGPWLLVNYGNLAWLHYHQGEERESQRWLSKAAALIEEYQSSSEHDLHPEIYAEKGWALLKCKSTEKCVVLTCFQKASEMQPDMVEWHTSYVLASINYQEPDMLDKMKEVKERDPENLFLAAKYLLMLAKNGEQVLEEARILAAKVLKNPVSSYSGLRTILDIYRHNDSVDEAIALAEKAVTNHPDVRFLKRCAAICYKWKIASQNSHPTSQEIERAIQVHKDVISLYPKSSLVKKMDLANIYTKSAHSSSQAKKIYRELLESDLKPPEKQVLFNIYAKHAYFHLKDSRKSIRYHMKAAEIPQESFFRKNSIRELEKIKATGKSDMCGEIATFLTNLQMQSTLDRELTNLQINPCP